MLSDDVCGLGLTNIQAISCNEARVLNQAEYSNRESRASVSSTSIGRGYLTAMPRPWLLRTAHDHRC
jgi:hypothetical protein